MNMKETFSRRTFLGAMAAAPLATIVAHRTHLPVGLELYSVRTELAKDLKATVRGVAKMGYECVEFFAPYYDWTPEFARQVRAEMDELGIRCYSTHNGLNSFTAEGIGKAIDLNNILGARYVVLAYPGDLKTRDDWKRLAETLNTANATLQRQGLHAGYHNHSLEWTPVDAQKPMELLSTTLDKSIMLQLDVGTCLAAGSDPVDWINRNPGRIRSMHLKDWSPQKQYRALLGEGIAPWKKIFAAAEKTGGIEFYLIEQEGSTYSEMETAERCLEAFRKLHDGV
jgi:sugar phosphate isomerase/epimerase